MKKKRFNIERVAFMATIVFIVGVITFVFAEDDMKWVIPLGAMFFLPGAYFTYDYFSGGDPDLNVGARYKKIFWDDIEYKPYQPISFFDWYKYLSEFIVFAVVIGFLLISGVILFGLKWARNYGNGDEETVITNKTTAEVIRNPAYELSNNIVNEMSHSSAYLTEDTAVLNNFTSIIVLCSFVAFACALLLFVFRKKNFKIAKFIRWFSYLLATISLLGGLFFVIFQDNFFVSDDLATLMENKNTTPEVISPGQTIKITLPNTSNVNSIRRNYKILSFNIDKSFARLKNDSLARFQSIGMQPKDKWREMKTDDAESLVYPEFNMTIPSDSNLNGSIIEMNVSLLLTIPYFKDGYTGAYYEKRAEMNEDLVFRIANPEEVEFYNSAGRLSSMIWYIILVSFILFILTLIFVGNSVNKQKIKE